MTKFSTSIFCEHFPACSGCSLQENVHQPPSYFLLKSFLEKYGIDPPLYFAEPTKWRIKAKLTVRGSSDNPSIGLFQENTHEIVDIPKCQVHHPLINEMMTFVKEVIKEIEIEPYQEKGNSGLLRTMQCLVNPKTHEMQLAFVFNQRGRSKKIDRFLEKLSSKKEIVSLWVNYNVKRTNILFSEDWELISNDPFLTLSFLDKTFFFHPACFVQANIHVFEKILLDIREHIIQDKEVIELYSGVGVIGLNLIDRVKKLHLLEINPFAKAPFEKSLTLLSSEKVFFETKDAKDLSDIQEEILIVDPPRKGLSLEVLKKIKEAALLKQIIYISCSPTSFCRDAATLFSYGWKLKLCKTFLLFPGSDHIETLGIFTL